MWRLSYGGSTMGEVEDGVVGEVDVLQVFELFEEWGESVEGFILSEGWNTLRSSFVNW